MSSTARFTYPFATSPDIIRSHQKDAYFSGVLLEQLSSLVRKIYGARFTHTYNSEARVLNELLYLGLTTLIGNRTLGEEYCDIVQVEGENGRLPALGRRAGYIVSCILGPYLLGRILPPFRRRVRAKLEANLNRHARAQAKVQEQHAQASSKTSAASTTPLVPRIQKYILQNLDTITSPSPLYALSLATFYFSGSYYHLSKRLWNLRYIFTRRVADSDQRVGYEVLGVLLALQMGVQAYLHLQNTLTSEDDDVASHAHSTTIIGNASITTLSLDLNAYTPNNALLFDSHAHPSSAGPSALQKITHTPTSHTPHYDLADPDTLAWISSANRKCTLCLEEMKDPSVTTCGHVFCWSCIVDWAREKPECPLCRQACGAMHVLPLRG